MAKLLVLISALLSVSCSNIHQEDIAFFKSVYKPILATPQTETAKQIQDSKRISFSAEGITMKDFAIWFSREFDTKINLPIRKFTLNCVTHQLKKFATL
jgi:hypothetical protein